MKISDKYAREEIESIIIKLQILIESHFDSGEQALADELLGEIRALNVEVERLSQASHRAWSLLKQVLDDEESQPGAWGPDITMLRFIKEAQAAIEKGPQP